MHILKDVVSYEMGMAQDGSLKPYVTKAMCHPDADLNWERKSRQILHEISVLHLPLSFAKEE